jgi:hypothetical protein
MNGKVPKNLGVGKVNAFVVVVHNDRAPSDEEWQAYIDFTVRHFERGMHVRFLITTTGGAPTVSQQKKIIDWAISHSKDPDAVRSAVVSSSTYARGTVQVVHQRGPNVRSFPPDNMAGALAFLGVPPAYHKQIAELEASLRAQLD